jgi:hypothetical protein
VRDVAGKAASLPQTEGPERGKATCVDHLVHLSAAAPARYVLILLAQTTARAQERAFDHGQGHSGAPGDLGVGQALELPEHHDRVLPLGEAAERRVQRGQLLTLFEAGVRRGRRRD